MVTQLDHLSQHLCKSTVLINQYGCMYSCKFTNYVGWIKLSSAPFTWINTTLIHGNLRAPESEVCCFSVKHTHRYIECCHIIRLLMNTIRLHIHRVTRLHWQYSLVCSQYSDIDNVGALYLTYNADLLNVQKKYIFKLFPSLKSIIVYFTVHKSSFIDKSAAARGPWALTFRQHSKPS